MCGILGGNNPAWDYEMGIAAIEHRGPDGKRIEKYNDITLAFCRLAIQDLSDRAMQPMSSPDQMVHIVYNGEIYGYQRLKKELQRKYPFRTSSDTEVMLYAYMEYGEAFVDKVDGIFSLAVYDERIQKIYLYRDRMGVKPLYYYCNNKEFAFASELKALEAAIGIDNLTVDKLALYDYLFYRYVPEPKSMYKEVYKLRPASILIYDVKKGKITDNHRYWNLDVNTTVERKRKKQDLSEELKFLISKTVQEQLISDVPIGTFLSGGIDSSIITYETHKIDDRVNAFSIGFQEAQYDESQRAKLFCQKCGIKLNNRILVNSDIGKIRTHLSKWYDEPFADVSAYPTYLVSKLAKEKCTVVLTGDGGDELFGGYEHYMSMYALGCSAGFEDACSIYTKGADAVEDFRIKWNIPKDYDPYWHYRQYYVEDLPVVTRMRYLDVMTYLPESILTKVDRTSMAVSLEARVPFLARDLVEFAFSLSQEEYFSENELKGCLKDAYKNVIPQDILYGIKMGFGVPNNYLWREKHEQNLYAGVLKTQWRELDHMVFAE